MKSWSSLKLQPHVLNPVVAEAAAFYNVHPKDVLGQGKNRPIAYARQYAMWKLREIRRPNGDHAYGWKEIGRRFHRDHTTVIHAHRRYEERRKAIQWAAE